MTTRFAGITLQPSHTIGRAEFSGPGFRNPVAMVRGEDDTMYVVSRSYEYRPDGKRITICTIDEDYIGEFARGVTTTGDGEASDADGSLIWPTAIALDSEGTVFVADEWLNRISVFTGDGAYLRKWGNPGSGDGEISSPAGLAFDQDDNLLLVDCDNHRVQRFTRDGQYISQFGGKGDGDGEFNMPWGITVDRHGDIYIADWRNDRVQKFSSDGRYLMTIGAPGSAEGQLNRPTGVAVDKDGYVYVADWGNDRVQMFNTEGHYLWSFRGDASLSRVARSYMLTNAVPNRLREMGRLETEKFLRRPRSVRIDDEFRLFIPDYESYRVQIYQKDAIPLERGQFAGPLRNVTLEVT